MRIAPNNNFPATHFIEVYDFGSYDITESTAYPLGIISLESALFMTKALFGKTIAIFRIRENKLPTLYNFKNK